MLSTAVQKMLSFQQKCWVLTLFREYNYIGLLDSAVETLTEYFSNFNKSATNSIVDILIPSIFHLPIRRSWFHKTQHFCTICNKLNIFLRFRYGIFWVFRMYYSWFEACIRGQNQNIQILNRMFVCLNKYICSFLLTKCCPGNARKLNISQHFAQNSTFLRKTQHFIVGRSECFGCITVGLRNAYNKNIQRLNRMFVCLDKSLYVFAPSNGCPANSSKLNIFNKLNIF